MLVAEFANTTDLGPTRRVRSLHASVGNSVRPHPHATTTVYPNLREITGEYLMREVDVFTCEAIIALGAEVVTAPRICQAAHAVQCPQWGESRHREITRLVAG